MPTAPGDPDATVDPAPERALDGAGDPLGAHRADVQVDTLPGGSAGGSAGADARPRVRRRRRRTGRRAWATRAGIAMITVGVLILAWLGWQIWGTTWLSHRHQKEVVAGLEHAWDDGDDTVNTRFGRAIALLRVPRFGDDYVMPVLEGWSDDVLAAGVGHEDGTALPGEIGNVVLAGHRITHGEPFADLPDLRPGDTIELETRSAIYTYVLDTGGTDLVVPFTDTWVTDPQPVNPDAGGTAPEKSSRRIVTLLTCSELFHTDNRSVVFGHLLSTEAIRR